MVTPWSARIFLKLGEGCGIFEHRELAVRIAGIVSRGEFDGVDLQRREFLENRGQRKLRQQGSKDSNAHKAFLSSKSNGRHSIAAAR